MNNLIFSIMMGGITNHYVGSDLNYCNLVNDYGTIVNPYAIIMAGSEDFKLGGIVGRDSVCENIYGAVLSKNIIKDLDFVVGGYNHNERSYEMRGIRSFGIGGITPVLGLNYKVPIIKTKKYTIELNNLLSIGITTHSLGISF